MSQPRRSARATTSHPPNRSETVSSNSSTRERSTRNKQQSPQKSSTPQSLSSEDVDQSKSDAPQTRRSKRGQDAEDEDNTKEEEDVGDDIAEEEEITRCICGQQEYPGPPELGHSHGRSSAPAAVDPLSDEAGGLFIQCDKCQVWQHGGCVGIMNEVMSPENYYCEQCRKDLHRLMTDPQGQRYSRYQPVVEAQVPKSHRKSSVSKDPETKSSKEKEKATRAQAEAYTKRRSTMNSRAAWEEDEVLRKVLEESKSEGISGRKTSTDAGESMLSSNRRGKRGRDESDDVKPETKRQRTTSDSPSAPSKAGSASPAESDDETSKNATTKKPRGAAAHSHREKELREREKTKTKEREEAANKRKERAGRRRAEGGLSQSLNQEFRELTFNADSEQPEGTPKPTDENPSTSQPPPDTPSHPTSTPTTTTTIPTSKRGGGRPPTKRSNRFGRNQYTRDRDNPTPNGDNTASPYRANGKGSGKDKDNSSSSPQTNGANLGSGNHSGGDSGGGTGEREGKGPGRGYHRKAVKSVEKSSMNEMRRRAALMLDNITRTQLDMAEQMGKRRALGMPGQEDPAAGGPVKEPRGNASATGSSEEGGELERLKDFGELGTVEMMDVLTRQLVLWQKEYGKYGEKQ